MNKQVLTALSTFDYVTDFIVFLHFLETRNSLLPTSNVQRRQTTDGSVVATALAGGRRQEAQTADRRTDKQINNRTVPGIVRLEVRMKNEMNERPNK